MTPRELIDSLSAVNKLIELTSKQDGVRIDALLLAGELIKEIEKQLRHGNSK